jgi:hypothetical protein
LLLVQHAFAFVQSNGDNPERRLLNEIEKHLIMAPTVWEFDLIRMIPSIDQWFENETDADEDDYELGFSFLGINKYFFYVIVLIRNRYHGVYWLKLKKKILFDQNQSLVGGLKHRVFK